jgi:nicotinamidase-related amidase
MMKTALICIDYVNEMVSQSGKLSGKGYYNFVNEHSTLSRVAEAQRRFRSEDNLVIHVRLGFSANYVEHPTKSLLVGKAKEFKALEIGTWGTEFADKVAPLDDDIVLIKHRISAFYGTSLDTILRVQGIQQIYLAGVATDLAVQSAARDAHDRDYEAIIIADCCAAANEDDHESSLKFLQKIATVKLLAEL